jgi:hypothetical protein
VINHRLRAGLSARALASAALLTVLASDAGAAEALSWVGPLAVAETISGDQLRLDDGRVVRLAGIRVPSGEVKMPGSLPSRRAPR